jgi:hypothetical protein
LVVEPFSQTNGIRAAGIAAQRVLASFMGSKCSPSETLCPTMADDAKCEVKFRPLHGVDEPRAGLVDGFGRFWHDQFKFEKTA